MKILRRNDDTPEEKLQLAKNGKGVGLSLTTLGAAGVGLGKLGELINTAPIDPKIADKVIERKTTKAVNRLVKKGVKNVDINKVRETVLDKLNKQGVHPEVIKNSKRAGKYLFAVGAPLYGYSKYKEYQAKKEMNNENNKKS